MRISRISAENIAKAALANKKKDWETAEKNFEQQVYGLVLSKTPTELLSVQKNHSEYINQSSSFKFCTKGGENADYTYYRSAKRLPTTNSYLTITDLELKEIHVSSKKVEKCKNLYNQSVDELATALVQLGTHKRVITELPELEKFLPKDNTSALVPNMDKIRELIK